MKNISSDDLCHDINSSLSALLSSLEIIKEEWKTNPELVDRLLPLSVEKIHQLQAQMQKFNQSLK